MDNAPHPCKVRNDKKLRFAAIHLQEILAAKKLHSLSVGICSPAPGQQGLFVFYPACEQKPTACPPSVDGISVHYAPLPYSAFACQSLA